MTIDQFVLFIGDRIANPLILLMMAVALVYFVWGVFVFVKDSSSPDAREKGKQHIIWGLLGLLIMVAAYAIIEIALNTVF